MLVRGFGSLIGGGRRGKELSFHFPSTINNLKDISLIMEENSDSHL